MPEPLGTVLIVDDHEDTRVALAELIAYGGFRVEMAGDGLEGLAHLRCIGVRPLVVILDLAMPEMDGHAFLQAKAADPELRHIPVIVHSAVHPWGLPSNVRFLPKGTTDPGELLDVIGRECRKAEAN